MTLTLEQYCEKHGYELIEEYTTLGEARGPHKRARVKDKETDKEYRLYFDKSRKPSKPRIDEEGQFIGYTRGNRRGWRNTTKERQRPAQKLDCDKCEGTGNDLFLGLACTICEGRGYVRTG